MASVYEMVYEAGLSMSVVIGGVILAILVYITQLYRRSHRQRATPKYPKDTVILFALPRGRNVPFNLSPFPVKLETYFRFAKIPYKIVIAKSLRRSPKHKTPWIEYNGQVIGDSSLIVQFLNKKFKVDLNKHMSPVERSIARAFQKMVEENTYWGHVYWMFLDRRNPARLHKIFVGPYLLKQLKAYVFKRRQARSMYSHGIGRHTEAEVYSIIEKDLRAISAFLGEKKFLFGDEPCEEDCAIFGLMANILWSHHADSPLQMLIKSELKNLDKYCYTMKERFWPDWEQCTLGNNAPLSQTHRLTDSHVLMVEELKLWGL